MLSPLFGSLEEQRLVFPLFVVLYSLLLAQSLLYCYIIIAYKYLLNDYLHEGRYPITSKNFPSLDYFPMWPYYSPHFIKNAYRYWLFIRFCTLWKLCFFSSSSGSGKKSSLRKKGMKPSIMQPQTASKRVPFDFYCNPSKQSQSDLPQLSL